MLEKKEGDLLAYDNFVRYEKVPKYTVNQLEKLIDSTNVGDYVVFETVNTDEYGHRKVEKAKGYVREKYPYIFKLSDGRYYQWKDVLLGR